MRGRLAPGLGTSSAFRASMARYIPMAIYAPELGVHALADNNEWVNGNFPEIIIMRLLYSLFGSALLVLAVVAQAETPLSPASERYIEMLSNGGPSTIRSTARSMHRSGEDRKSTRLNSSHVAISYAVFCLTKK